MVCSLVAAALLLPLIVSAQQAVYGQCGGIGWSGATTCTSGSTCVELNSYYYQCLPGSSTPTSTPVVTQTPAPTTLKTSTVTTPKNPSTGGTATLPGSPSTTLPGSSNPSGTGPGTTLQPNWYWIRSVESPNFHMYLQTNPEYTTGTAILDSYTKAGQFNIINGQLVELIDPVTKKQLYANVQQPANSSVTKLAMSFEATPNTFGNFSFSGDAVQWSVASIDRPNDSAWLVCAEQQLFINLGAYDYDTPAGCADETIHYYNGATAVD